MYKQLQFKFKDVNQLEFECLHLPLIEWCRHRDDIMKEWFYDMVVRTFRGEFGLDK